MSQPKSAFSKFQFKPSALSQHTENFNKILEKIPAPKIDSSALNLAKPTLEKPKQQETPSTTAVNSATATAAPSNSTNNENAAEDTKIIFGQNLNDRVINAASPSNLENEADSSENLNGECSSKTKSSCTALWSSANESEFAEKNEIEECNTIMKINCKLYVLESDKANWAERGYGILKLIDIPDENNCKIMMWMDKSFRLLLNTKLFEKMQIDKLNKKSLRFNAFDSGTIRIFLVKAAQTDCDELYDMMTMRLGEFNDSLRNRTQNSTSQETDNTPSSSLATTTSKQLYKSQKTVLFKCECTYNTECLISGEQKEEANVSKTARLHLYTYNGNSDSASSITSSNSHQLLLDLVDSEDESQVILTTYLKLIRINNKSKTARTANVEFEISDSVLQKSSDDSFSSKAQLNYKISIGDKTLSQEFLTLYNKEPKVRASDLSSDNSSSNSDNDDDDDDSNNQTETSENEEDEENEDFTGPNRKSNSTFESERFASSGGEEEPSSTSRKRKSNNEDYDDDGETVPSAFKKQEIDNSGSKNNEDSEAAQSSQEDHDLVASTSGNNNKRSVCEFSSQEEEDNCKKTKVSAEEEN